MTIESQLGSIVSRLRVAEIELAAADGFLEDCRNDQAKLHELIARLQADLVTLRAQIARPE